MKVLLVEDDALIAKGLTYILEQSGYEVEYNKCIMDAIKHVKKERPDFAILDISLPDGSGLNLYKHHILDIDVPTIFLTAIDDEETIVDCLEIGADDYIVKPFSNKELLARMKKIILRQKKNQKLKVADIEFDLEKMVVLKEGEEVSLTSLELKILHVLFMNLNKVVTRNEIIDRIWDWTGNDVNDNTVTVYLKRIRKKIETDIIVTIKGIGYRIDEDGK